MGLWIRGKVVVAAAVAAAGAVVVGGELSVRIDCVTHCGRRPIKAQAPTDRKADARIPS